MTILESIAFGVVNLYAICYNKRLATKNNRSILGLESEEHGVWLPILDRDRVPFWYIIKIV